MVILITLLCLCFVTLLKKTSDKISCIAFVLEQYIQLRNDIFLENLEELKTNPVDPDTFGW